MSSSYSNLLRKWISKDELKRLFFALYMDLVNFYSDRSILGHNDVVVSMTSYGNRIKQVHRAIESIGRGSQKPRRFILWLSTKDLNRPLPIPLERLKRRGLEVCGCEDTKSFKKFYPYVTSLKSTYPLVTSDDDLFYPRWWLSSLLEFSNIYPDNIIAHRCKVISLKENKLAPYESWEFVNQSLVFSKRFFPTSGAGVIYPFHFLRFLSRAGNDFLKCCPNADDLWLHVNSVRADILSCQTYDSPMELIQMPWTWNSALCLKNVLQQGNDRQIEKTYNKSDIQSIFKEII